MLFEPVAVAGTQFADGGKVDRVGLRGWRARRRAEGPADPPPALAHVISRSSPFSGDDDVARLAKEEERVAYVRCPKAGVSLLSLGDFDAQFYAAFGRAYLELKGSDVVRDALHPRQ